MPDPKLTPGTAPVTDHRPVPRGVLPQGIQTWLMVGLAVGIVLVIFIAGRTKPATPRPATAPITPTLNEDTVRAYQERLRALETEAAQQEQAAANAPMRTAAMPGAPAGSQDDPTAAERKKRAYDSLFASNVALSRRPAADRPDVGAQASRGLSSASALSAPTPNAPPSLDALADAVVRATTRAQQPGSGAVFATARSTTARATSASTAAASPSAEPTHTPALRDAGPLHTILEGTIIEAVLTNRLDGSLPSPVNCLVTSPVYTFSGQEVLIPAGARLLGETRPVQAFGETRLAVAFHRLVLPDGSTESLDQLPAMNQRGDAGLHDQVNAHYWSTFGAAAAIGLVSGLASAVGTVGLAGGTGNRGVVIAGETANRASEASAQVMNRLLNRLPTITIREGHRVKVYVTSDLHLPAYASASILP